MLSGTRKMLLQRVSNVKLPLRTLMKMRINHRRPFHCTCLRKGKSVETPLVKQLQARIHINGPLTVADYMKEVLTNPSAGYYMHKDVFGSKGDFVTSPEISQMFGELLGVWCVSEWYETASPSPVQIIELGPGRGTLIDDMLRACKQLPGNLYDSLSVHLVEVSPHLSQMQYDKLTAGTAQSSRAAGDRQRSPDNDSRTRDASNEEMLADGHQETRSPSATESDSCSDETPAKGRPHKEDPGTAYMTGRSKHGPMVSWYRQLADVPRGFSFIIAHEFLDALPIHKFQKKDGAWCEVLIDVDSTPDGAHHLRYVLSPGATTATTLLLKNMVEDDCRDHLELCPEAGIVLQQVAERVASDGGRALLADYGHNGDKTDTFRAFKMHDVHDPLCEPGLADLTADVDFSYLSRQVADIVDVCGPVTQHDFLHSMGIGYRLKSIFDQGRVTMEQRKSLISGFDMLVNPEKMGERFKFMALQPLEMKHRAPAGFRPLS